MEDRGDLIGKDIAHKLFYELWLPAEMMKIKSVTTPDRTATLTFPLKKDAHYNGLRPEAFMQVTITEAEVNAAIEIPLRRSMSKAAYLLQHAEAVEATAGETDSGAGGLDFGFGDTGSDSGVGSTGGDATIVQSPSCWLVTRRVCQWSVKWPKNYSAFHQKKLSWMLAASKPRWHKVPAKNTFCVVTSVAAVA